MTPLYKHERLYRAKRDAGPALFEALVSIKALVERAAWARHSDGRCVAATEAIDEIELIVTNALAEVTK
jgi:hypothetical protein